ncbi:ABC transporter ATP-binding protein [Aquimarina agarivorans]|uniref:ABC transporter ATP-binding protein n=1 Tax=Aquimarina agarivorans TaxID=980584 RepID=UPI000248EB94|nr:ATP-binding cassette domain-containing protein [Aquimarina agarivorans]
MIRVENLHKGFGGTEILKGISTTFEKGKTNLIIGTSGSGKTVFLKCLLGLFSPEEGEIIYGDTDYDDLDESEKRDLKEQMGMVFQGSALFDSMTVAENVRFPLEMFTKKSKKEMNLRVSEVLERVNLENADGKLPSEISGGMQKRVAIARAIVTNPKYLFCDEPNSGLDPKTSIVIDNLIKEITEEFNMTTIINTHDMNSVMEIGEKIVFLKQGYLEWEGDKTQIFKTENKAVTDFVYSSNLFKKVREAQLKGL